jgi:hypothetical protein
MLLILDQDLRSHRSGVTHCFYGSSIDHTPRISTAWILLGWSRWEEVYRMALRDPN